MATDWAQDIVNSGGIQDYIRRAETGPTWPKTDLALLVLPGPYEGSARVLATTRTFLAAQAEKQGWPKDKADLIRYPPIGMDPVLFNHPDNRTELAYMNRTGLNVVLNRPEGHA